MPSMAVVHPDQRSRTAVHARAESPASASRASFAPDDWPPQVTSVTRRRYPQEIRVRDLAQRQDRCGGLDWADTSALRASRQRRLGPRCVHWERLPAPQTDWEPMQVVVRAVSRGPDVPRHWPRPLARWPPLQVEVDSQRDRGQCDLPHREHCRESVASRSPAAAVAMMAVAAAVPCRDPACGDFCRLQRSWHRRRRSRSPCRQRVPPEVPAQRAHPSVRPEQPPEGWRPGIEVAPGATGTAVLSAV